MTPAFIDGLAALGLVAAAELGDKSQLVCIGLAARHRGLPVLVGAVAGWLLGTSPLQLQGRAPNGQWFAIRPTRLWAVTAGAAVVAGRDLGPLVRPHRPTHLDDIVLPDRGLFMAGEWLCERHDPARHGPTRSDTPGPDTPLRRGA